MQHATAILELKNSNFLQALTHHQGIHTCKCRALLLFRQFALIVCNIEMDTDIHNISVIILPSHVEGREEKLSNDFEVGVSDTGISTPSGFRDT